MMPRMDTLSRPADGARPPVELAGPLAAGQAALTRRTLLRVAGGGLIAAGLRGVRTRSGVTEVVLRPDDTAEAQW